MKYIFQLDSILQWFKGISGAKQVAKTINTADPAVRALHERLLPTSVRSIHGGRLALKRDPETNTVYLVKENEHGAGFSFDLTPLTAEEARHATASKDSLQKYDQSSPKRWIDDSSS